VTFTANVQSHEDVQLKTHFVAVFSFHALFDSVCLLCIVVGVCSTNCRLLWSASCPL